MTLALLLGGEEEEVPEEVNWYFGQREGERVTSLLTQAASDQVRARWQANAVH